MNLPLKVKIVLKTFLTIILNNLDMVMNVLKNSSAAVCTNVHGVDV